jgi:sugar/nucleoside kinase (ribokinase family)
MAGLILSLNRGEGLERAAAYASAAAAATLQQVVCGSLDPTDVESFLNLTHIQPLTAAETLR